MAAVVNTHLQVQAVQEDYNCTFLTLAVDGDESINFKPGKGILGTLPV